VRPFSEKERLLLNSNHDAGPALFNSDNAAASTSTGPPIYSTPQPARGPGSLRKVLKVLDERILVFDPPETNAVASFHKANMPMQGKKTKDIRFCFDRVFDEDCGQEEVYDGSAKELVGHVMDGFHSTVFAYGVGRGVLHHKLQKKNADVLSGAGYWMRKDAHHLRFLRPAWHRLPHHEGPLRSHRL
jgi:kinesin family protein 18/19